MTRKLLLSLAGGALVAALAFGSNPSGNAHRAAIKAAVAERSPVAGALGLGALAAFTTTYHSWGLCSYTTVNGRTLSVGAFGVVHVRDLLPSDSSR